MFTYDVGNWNGQYIVSTTKFNFGDKFVYNSVTYVFDEQLDFEKVHDFFAKDPKGKLVKFTYDGHTDTIKLCK